MKIVVLVVLVTIINNLLKKKLQYVQQTSFQKGRFNIGLLKDRLQVLSKELIDLKKELKEANEMLENNSTITITDNELNNDISIANVQSINSSIINDDSNTNPKNINNNIINKETGQLTDQTISKDSSIKKDEQSRQIMKIIQPQQIQEVNPKIQNEFDEINRTIEHNHFNFTTNQDDEHAKDLVIHIQKSFQSKDDPQFNLTYQSNDKNQLNQQVKPNQQPKPTNDIQPITLDLHQQSKQSEDQQKQPIVDQNQSIKEFSNNSTKEQKDNPTKEQRMQKKIQSDKKDEQNDKKDEQNDKKDEQNGKKMIESKSPVIQMEKKLSIEEQEEKIAKDYFPEKFMNQLDMNKEDGNFMVLDKSRSEQIVIHIK